MSPDMQHGPGRSSIIILYKVKLKVKSYRISYFTMFKRFFANAIRVRAIYHYGERLLTSRDYRYRWSKVKSKIADF